MTGKSGTMVSAGRSGSDDILARPAERCLGAGARTPEELETFLEDALVTRDPEALASLFLPSATFVAGNGRSARGGTIASLALETWKGDHIYIADPRRVVQAGDIALILAEETFNVALRSDNGDWRYAIVLQPTDDKRVMNMKGKIHDSEQ